MNRSLIPLFFLQLQAEGYLHENDIVNTLDGFYLAYKSIADILAEKDIFDFPGSDGKRLLCNHFYDDWFLFAVPSASDYSYGLIKFREQEHDAEDGSPADADTPGVTISFIAFTCEILHNCLVNPTDENRQRLDGEINRVVSRRGQCHHNDLKRYFIDPKSEGPYLLADRYVKHIASFASKGYLDTPKHYRQIVKQSDIRKNSAHYARLPRFIASINQKAGCVVCDNEKIYIKNREEPTFYESAAILATHTGNTSQYSFAAEIEYHARFLTSMAKLRIPVLGRSLYDSAIRADMSICDAEFQGPTPFYRDESKIVKRQYTLHHKESVILGNESVSGTGKGD